MAAATLSPMSCRLSGWCPEIRLFRKPLMLILIERSTASIRYVFFARNKAVRIFSLFLSSKSV